VTSNQTKANIEVECNLDVAMFPAQQFVEGEAWNLLHATTWMVSLVHQKVTSEMDSKQDCLFLVVSVSFLVIKIDLVKNWLIKSEINVKNL